MIPSRTTGLVSLTGHPRSARTACFRTKFNLSVRGRQLSDDAPLPPDLREEYARENGPTIDEGIDALKRAISIKPDYDDAMAYLNLAYRRKADIVASESERDELIKMAEDLVDKVKEIKEKRAEAAAAIAHDGKA